MTRDFEVRWEGELPAPPEVVWDGFTRHCDGWLWRVEYEPRLGGRERGLSSPGGTVTAWDPPRHFRTRSTDGHTINQLDYRLEPCGSGTYLRYVHTGGLSDDDYDLQLDACEQHTAFYYHSLGEYVRHFPGRTAAYVNVDAPAASAAPGGFAALRQALGVPDEVVVGETVRLTPAGIDPIDGTVDYVTDVFLGVRSADSLYRVYGREVWGWPVGVAHHLFAPGVDQDRSPPRPGPHLRGDRLAPDPDALRRVGAGLAVACRGAQPGRGGRDGRGPRRGPGRGRGVGARRSPGRIPLPARHEGRPAAPARAGRRGGAGLPGGARTQ